jgi:hypothetical protein
MVCGAIDRNRLARHAREIEYIVLSHFPYVCTGLRGLVDSSAQGRGVPKGEACVSVSGKSVVATQSATSSHPSPSTDPGITFRLAFPTRPILAAALRPVR